MFVKQFHIANQGAQDMTHLTPTAASKWNDLIDCGVCVLTILLFTLVAAASAARAQTFQTLYAFTGSASGQTPFGLAPWGNDALAGSAQGGINCNEEVCGVLY